MDENLEWEPLLKIAAEAGGRDGEVPVREEAGAGQQTGNVAEFAGKQAGKRAWKHTAFPPGIARDEAFCFYYEDNLRLWNRPGPAYYLVCSIRRNWQMGWTG